MNKYTIQGRKSDWRLKYNGNLISNLSYASLASARLDALDHADDHNIGSMVFEVIDDSAIPTGKFVASETVKSWDDLKEYSVTVEDSESGEEIVSFNLELGEINVNDFIGIGDGSYDVGSEALVEFARKILIFNTLKKERERLAHFLKVSDEKGGAPGYHHVSIKNSRQAISDLMEVIKA